MNIYTQNCVIRDKVIFLHHHLSRSPSEFLHQLGLFYTSSVSTVSTFLHLCRWILEPPVHKTLPEDFSIRLFRENSSSRLFWNNSSSRHFRKNSSSRLVDSYGRTQLMFYLKHAVPSHSSSLLTVTVRTLSYI